VFLLVAGLRFRRSGSSGIAGWRDDDLSHVRAWGFALDSISVPVMVWQGSEDRGVPAPHGHWLAKHVPGATVQLVEGEGHISSITKRIGDILDTMITLRDRKPAGAGR
jgi:pimeloyl-ACP methyl ester carboxylesterase